MTAPRFADELLQAARGPEPATEVARILRKWGGCRIYVHRRTLGADSAADAAFRLVAAGVPRQTAQRILRQRRGISARHARRLVARAVAARGQSVAASRGTIPAP